MIECKQILKVTCDTCGKEKTIETNFCFEDDQPRPLAVIQNAGWVWHCNGDRFICPDHYDLHK